MESFCRNQAALVCNSRGTVTEQTVQQTLLFRHCHTASVQLKHDDRAFIEEGEAT